MEKTRNWSFILYPESAPEGWQGLLENYHMKIFISPLHDLDKDGDLFKKPHHHIVLCSEGPITKKRADEIIAPFCGTKSAERVQSLRGIVRYLAHLDDPLKAQYDPADIVALGGANLADFLCNKNSDIDKYQIIKQIMVYCQESEITELSTLTKYAMNEHEDWLPILVNNAYFMTRLLDSLRYSSRR